jgi:hypothetical protein
MIRDLSSFCLPLAAELCFTIKADWTDDALIRHTTALAGSHDSSVHLLRFVHLLAFSWHFRALKVADHNADRQNGANKTQQSQLEVRVGPDLVAPRPS